MTLGTDRTVRTDRVAILETEPEGHRLQYLNHLVTAAGADRAVVLTSDAAVRSVEYAEHVAGGVRTVVLPADPDGDREGVLRAAVDAALDAGVTRIVVPDGDQYLLALVRLMLRRPRLRLGITLLLMRTTVIGGPERLRAATLVKPALVQLLRPFRRVRVLFVTDALGVVRRRRGFLGVRPVADPVDVTAVAGLATAHPRPAWFPAADPDTTLVGLFGVVDERKNLPLLVEALDADPALRLVVGGRLHPALRAFLDGDATACRLAGEGRLHVQDRLLPAAEFGAALAGVDVAAVLHDNDAPSGILAEACLRRTPVVVPAGAWLARVVDQTGIGVATALHGRAVAAAIRLVASDSARFAVATERGASRLGTNSFTEGLLAP